MSKQAKEAVMTEELWQLIEAFIDEKLANVDTGQGKDNLDTNLAELAEEYPVLQEEAGYEQFGVGLVELAQEWGVEHLLEAPPVELLYAACFRVFGSSRPQVAEKAREAGKEEAVRKFMRKSGLAAGSTRPKKDEVTPTNQIKKAILEAGHKSILG